MDHFTIRIPDEQREKIEEYENENDLSRSEAGRELLSQGLEYERVTEENQRLRNKIEALVGRQDEHGELVEYVEEEQDLQQIQREKATAPLIQRVKWLIWGYDGN